MKIKVILMAVVVSLVLVFGSSFPVGAFPPLPAGFYGAVKMGGSNVPAGTLIEASINGVVYARAYTQMYAGDSVYSIQVLGDDSETPGIEGGLPGQTIHFSVGGVQFPQTAVWASGSNLSLELVAGPNAVNLVSFQSHGQNGFDGSSLPVSLLTAVLAGLGLFLSSRLLWDYGRRKG